MTTIETSFGKITYEYRARYYSADLGSFISRDPLEYVDGMNVYAGYFAYGMAMDPWGLEASSINKIAGLNINGYRLTFINGINNDSNDAKQAATFVSRAFNNTTVDYVHNGSAKDPVKSTPEYEDLVEKYINETNWFVRQWLFSQMLQHQMEEDAKRRREALQGFVCDLGQCIIHKLGNTTTEVTLLVQLWKDKLEEMKKETKCKYTLVHTAHSQGALITQLALNKMSEEEKEHMIVLTYGPASIIHDSNLKHSMNNISVLDGVPITDGLDELTKRNHINYIKDGGLHVFILLIYFNFKEMGKNMVQVPWNRRLK